MPSKKRKRIPVWRFIPKNRKLRYGDNRKIVEGEALVVKGTIKTCENGIHGSVRFTDALRFLSDERCVLTAATLSGTIKKSPHKLAASRCATDRILTSKQTRAFLKAWLKEAEKYANGFYDSWAGLLTDSLFRKCRCINNALLENTKNRQKLDIFANDLWEQMFEKDE